jgi:hypothetical protein
MKVDSGGKGGVCLGSPKSPKISENKPPEMLANEVFPIFLSFSSRDSLLLPFVLFLPSLFLNNPG